MAEGHEVAEWNRASSLIAATYNAHRAPGAEWLEPALFHPYAPPPEKAVLKVPLKSMKAAFAKGIKGLKSVSVPASQIKVRPPSDPSQDKA